MAVETATYIGDLNETYPAGGEPVAQGDDHIRLIKAVLKASFPGLTGVYKPFPVGTKLMFPQAAAPIGWTQDVTDSADNRMLRVVKTAGAGVGGSHSPILNNVVPAHTHTVSTDTVNTNHYHYFDTGVSGGHEHLYNWQDNGHNAYGGPSGNFVGDGKTDRWTAGGGGHQHTGNTGYGSANQHHSHAGTAAANAGAESWAPRYVDLILATKD